MTSRMTQDRHRPDHRHGDDRPRMGRPAGTQHAAAALVALAVLRHHHLGDRLLDLVSGLAASSRPTRRACSAGIRATPSSSDLDSLQTQRGPMMQKLAAASLDQIVADPQLLDFARAVGKSAFAENCAACHGAGGAAPEAIPTSMTIIGCGAASSRTSSRPSRMACARMIRTHMPDAHDAGVRPRPACSSATEISAVADYVRSLNGLPTPNADLDARQEGLRRQLRRLPRRRRQGQPRSRARPISPMESGSTGAEQGRHRRRDRQWSRRA